MIFPCSRSHFLQVRLIIFYNCKIFQNFKQQFLSYRATLPCLFSIDINVHSAMLKYWIRLLTLPKSRLVSHCYWSLQNNPDRTDPWLRSIKNLIFSTGQCQIWNNQCDLADMGFKFANKHISYIFQNREQISFQ